MASPFGARPHAALGASTAARWMSCSGSVRLSAGIEVRASTYAEEGAAAHMLAKICLDEGVDAPGLIGRKVNGYAAEAEMADGVQVYLNAVRAELEPGDLLLVEQPFSLDRLRPPGEMFGTADAVIYKPGLRRLLVFDLKYGAGIVVEALGNPQGATTAWAPAWRWPIAR